jgi:hypothetical protein
MVALVDADVNGVLTAKWHAAGFKMTSRICVTRKLSTNEEEAKWGKRNRMFRL